MTSGYTTAPKFDLTTSACLPIDKQQAEVDKGWAYAVGDLLTFYKCDQRYRRGEALQEQDPPNVQSLINFAKTKLMKSDLRVPTLKFVRQGTYLGNDQNRLKFYIYSIEKGHMGESAMIEALRFGILGVRLKVQLKSFIAFNIQGVTVYKCGKPQILAISTTFDVILVGFEKRGELRYWKVKHRYYAQLGDETGFINIDMEMDCDITESAIFLYHHANLANSI